LIPSLRGTNKAPIKNSQVFRVGGWGCRIPASAFCNGKMPAVVGTRMGRKGEMGRYVRIA
jgi:hypothetical protein